MENEAYMRIIQESRDGEGILVSFRMAKPVPPARFKALREALAEVAEQAEQWSVIDKELAAALHALSFHLDGLAHNLKRINKLPEEIENELMFVFEWIDDIFDT